MSTEVQQAASAEPQKVETAPQTQAPAASPEASSSPTADSSNPMDAARAAFDRAMSTDKGKEAAPIADVAEPKPTTAGDPPRGPDGKFAPKTADSAQKTEAPVTGEVIPPTQAEVKAPPYLPADIKAVWKDTPQQVREYHELREREAQTRISRMGQQLSQVTPVVQFVEELESQFAPLGVDTATGVRNLLQWQQLAATDPAAYIRQFAQTHKVDLMELVTTEPTPVAMDPRVTMLEQRLQAREAADRQALQQQRDYEQHQFEQAHTATAAQVSQFAADKPDFQTLKTEILALIPAIQGAEPNLSPVDVLAQAYERARWANPTTRKALEEQIRTAATRNRLDEQKKQASAAKAAAAANVSTAPINGAPLYANAMEAARAAYERGLQRRSA